MIASTTKFDLSNKRVFIAGHSGMAGSALVRRLSCENCEILTADRAALDLTRQESTERWLSSVSPDVVLVAAAKVGGIIANSLFPVEFLYDNLAIELNVIRASHLAGVKKLVFLGSTCVYPRLAKQPMSEDQLLAGSLEPTNQWYAVAKIAGIKLCQAYRNQYGSDFVAVMPTNLYGPGDNYHPEHGHVVAALIRRFHEAKLENSSEVVVWGSGRPQREFLFVDDFADACVFVLKNYSDGEPINIGCGKDISIAEFAQTVADVIGYKGRIVFDPTRPDGTPRKLVDISKLSNLGWRPKVALNEGLHKAYSDFLGISQKGPLTSSQFESARQA